VRFVIDDIADITAAAQFLKTVIIKPKKEKALA